MHPLKASDAQVVHETYGFDFGPEDPPPVGPWDNGPELGRDGRVLPPSDMGADGMSCCCYRCPGVTTAECCRAAERRRLLEAMVARDLEAEGYTQGQARRNFIRLTIERIFHR